MRLGGFLCGFGSSSVGGYYGNYMNAMALRCWINGLIEHACSVLQFIFNNGLLLMRPRFLILLPTQLDRFIFCPFPMVASHREH